MTLLDYRIVEMGTGLFLIQYNDLARKNPGWVTISAAYETLKDARQGAEYIIKENTVKEIHEIRG